MPHLAAPCDSRGLPEKSFPHNLAFEAAHGPVAYAETVTPLEMTTDPEELLHGLRVGSS